MNDSVEALEIKVSFQDELLQQLDEALGRQQQEILLLKEQLRVCLLYTSPSPRDRQKSRMPSSA